MLNANTRPESSQTGVLTRFNTEMSLDIEVQKGRHVLGEESNNKLRMWQTLSVRLEIMLGKPRTVAEI